MASIFGHALLGVAIAKSAKRKTCIKIIGLAIFCTILPDADVVGHMLGVPYESPYGHRGFTHSILFAFLLAIFIKQVFFKEIKLFSWQGAGLFVIFFLSTLSHGLLDSMTTGGLGVAYFFPFDNSRYFFPFRPIKVSPIGVSAFFSEWGVRVLLSELVWVGIPAMSLLFLRFVYNKIIKK